MVMREALEEGIFLPTEHITMTEPRLELRPEWKRLAFKEMDSEAMVFMTLLPYKGEGWREGFVLQAEGLTISREVPLVFCPIDDQPY